MSWLTSHAVNPKLAAACGVTGEPGGTIEFRYGLSFTRYRRADGSMRQEPGKGTWLYWPCGGQRSAHSVLLTEGEGDTLAAASVLCEAKPQGANLPALVEPRDGLPPSLAGLVPVGLPGCTTPLRVICGELIAAGTKQAFICLDADEPGQRATDRIRREMAQYDIEAIPVELPEDTDLADNLAAADDRTAYLASLFPAPPPPVDRTHGQRLDDHGYVALKEIPAEVYIEWFTGEAPRRGMVSCPLPDHEDRTASCSVGRTHWNCFGCNRKGDIFDLAQELWGTDFKTTKGRLLQEFALENA